MILPECITEMGQTSVTDRVGNFRDATPSYSHSLAEGLSPGGDNLDGTDSNNNPLFITPVDPGDAPTPAGNLRLQAASPAIDAGNNDYVVGVSTDLDGNPRIFNETVDLGAYEFHPLSDGLFQDRFQAQGVN